MIQDKYECIKRSDCLYNKTQKCQKKPEKSSSQLLPQVLSSSDSPLSSHPPWYKIQEIKPTDFVSCVKGIYSVLEKTHQSKTNEDPFIKAVVTGYNNMSDIEWEQAETSRLSQKVLEMKMGDFHEEMMGKIPGYETYKVGHFTGCDVGSLDGKEIYEVKNKNNTTKGSDGKHIIQQLVKLLEAGKHPIFVQINCPNGKVNRFNAPKGVDVWNGRTTYHHMTGRDTFFDDLQETVQYVFSNYKTLQELKSALKIS
jgi:hypothetical protein